MILTRWQLLVRPPVVAIRDKFGPGAAGVKAAASDEDEEEDDNEGAGEDEGETEREKNARLKAEAMAVKEEVIMILERGILFSKSKGDASGDVDQYVPVFFLGGGAGIISRQPLPGIGILIPLRGRTACPEFNSLLRGVNSVTVPGGD